MNDGGMLKPALIAGVLLGILSIVPGLQLVNCACCAWVIGGGILAAHLYVKSSIVAVTLGRGMVLGLLTGGIGGMVYILFSIPLLIVMSGGTGRYFEQARQSLYGVPNLPQALREALASMPTGGSELAVLLVITGLLMIVAFSLPGMLGGLIGVALFEKRKIEGPTPVYHPPVYPPPPPPPAEDPPEQGSNPAS